MSLHSGILSSFRYYLNRIQQMKVIYLPDRVQIERVSLLGVLYPFADIFPLRIPFGIFIRTEVGTKITVNQNWSHFLPVFPFSLCLKDSFHRIFKIFYRYFEMALPVRHCASGNNHRVCFCHYTHGDILQLILLYKRFYLTMKNQLCFRSLKWWERLSTDQLAHIIFAPTMNHEQYIQFSLFLERSACKIITRLMNISL